MLKLVIMHKLFLGVGFLLFGIFYTLLTSETALASTSGVVIHRLQASGIVSGTTAQEAVEIRNTTSQDIKVTDWCIYYNVTIEIGCIKASNSQMQVYLRSQSSALFVSTEMSNLLKAANSAFVADILFTNLDKIAASSGSIKLVDTAAVVDMVGWGGGAAETLPATALVNGKMLNRISVAGIVQDTDNNSLDFRVDTTDTSLYSRGGLSEVYEPIDVCPNIPGLDTTVPIGFIKDTDSNCYEDVCDNMIGLQKNIPNGYYKSGIDCLAVKLQITELLPNVSGSDTGKEFIEIYNPTNYQVDLSGYLLQLGPGYSKNFILPSFILVPNSFVSFSDIETTITLPNTSASVKLLTPNSDFVDETSSYNEPKDDQAWALFADSWQYTNQPTAANSNMVSVVAGLGAGDDEELATCPEGKYRNPETNRCKTIETDAGLKPCAVDQIRNPETNRCRSIFASDSGLTPCKTDQTRNPETNRCRSTENSSNTLKPCAVNQERNPETNRCRKMTAGTIAANKVKDVESNLQAERGGWFLAGSAGIGLAGYGVAEWRTEISSAFRRFRQLLGKNPPTP